METNKVRSAEYEHKKRALIDESDPAGKGYHLIGKQIDASDDRE